MPELAPESNPLSRLELLQLAQSLGVSDADVMTRAELRTAIDKARRPAPIHTDQHPTTWVSVARRLLASVVERGLNLPDAASLIRGDTKLNSPPKAPPPVATVTLARIYGAQGHFDRALATLDEVLQSDPDHELARDLRNQLAIRRTESLARAANATPIPSRDDPESAPGVPESPVTPAEGSNHARKPSRLGTVNALEGLEARPFAGLDARAEAPSADARVLAATEATELDAPGAADARMAGNAQAAADAQALADMQAAAEAQAHGDAPSLAEAQSSADSPTSPQPPPLVGTTSSDVPVTEITPAAISLDADAELVSPAFAPTPPSVRPPPFVDAPTGSEPAFEGAPPSAQPPAFVDAPTGSELAFDGAPPSAQPPAFVHDAHPIDTLTERPSAPAFYTEPPTMVSTMALDRDTPPHPSVYLEPEHPPTIAAEADPALLRDAGRFERADAEELRAAPAAESAPDAAQTVEGASMAEPPEPSSNEPDTHAVDAVGAEPHPGSARSNTEPVPDRTPELAEPTPAPLAANAPPSHAGNGGVSNGIQNGVEPLPVAAPLPPSPPAPKVPGLVLIETDTPLRYLYWELAASGVGAMHWLHIVTHTPNRGGIERHERRFPIQQPLGALRLEGVPAHAVMRARLTRDADDARAVVVAGAVKPRTLGAPSFEIRYIPHAHSSPEALATRAQSLLERASPVYWDR
jgi:hypothetical protein